MYQMHPSWRPWLTCTRKVRDNSTAIHLHYSITNDLTTGLSPNGKYGFSVPAFQRTVPQYTEWTDTWEDFFSNSIRHVFEAEERTHGPDPEVQELEKAILTKVVPRLLRPLETGGRTIKPRLIHGDIWDGNVSTRAETEAPVIFDASCIYAHNECESRHLVIHAPS
jgi:protein-ribulosamine 3-kinase